MQNLHEAEYRVWLNMIGRCTNPNLKYFSVYGAKGIKVCPEWMISFEAFYAAMGPRPSPLHVVGRKDEKDNFTPDNCQWIRVNSNVIKPLDVNCLTELINKPPKPICFTDYEGANKTLAEWSKIKGIPYPVLHARINAKRWSLAKALETPHYTALHHEQRNEV